MSLEEFDYGGLTGRRKIFTDEKQITRDNVINVLSDAVIKHNDNAASIQFLLNYEKGVQPLIREKVARKDIDIKVCDNVANEVTEFKLGYNWGNPISYIQRGDKDKEKSNPNTDDNGIAMLNEMLKEECKPSKDQELARYIEICGVGYRYIDIKRDYDGGSVFEISTLNPLFTFLVYSNDIFRKPIMGVSFNRNDKTGDTYYTCFTKDTVFLIRNLYKIVGDEKTSETTLDNKYPNGTKNPLGMIPIIEYNRAYDRTGCFERQISDMDNLNILVSDFTNDVAQNTQTIWQANDVELPTKEDGSISVTSGQWIVTKTNGQGQKPSINPLTTDFDYSGIIENIKYRRDVILQKCDVPLRSEPGGGSTGTAMSMSSGWSDAEVSACKEQQIIDASERQTIKCLLKVISISTDIPEDSPIKKIKISDIEPKFTRNKTYDLATKVNSLATMVNIGVHGRIALETIDLFPDVEQTWIDSKEMIEKYQKSLVENKKAKDDKKIQSDLSDQSSNSPTVNM